MSLRIEVWSDFACPWCFLVASSLEKLRTTHRIALHWRAYELRPPGSPPIPAAYMEHIHRMTPRLHAIAREHYGIQLNRGPFGITTRTAHIGAKYAQAQGLGDRYHMAVFRAYFEQGEAIDDLHVLTRVAGEVGLEPAHFRAALDNEDFISAVLSDEMDAYEHGLTGVPALVFLRKYLVNGAQPYEVLKDIVELLETGAVG